MRLSYISFILAALAGTAGISLGIHMGLSQDFTLAPAHAHLNLLGWVSMAIYGLYHRVADSTSRLAWVQVLSAGLGFPAFAIGLAVYLATGTETVMPLAIAGSLACLAGMLLFLLIVIRDAMASQPRGTGQLSKLQP
jgi:cbb3-type cytochrome oxidase subunit 1